MLMSRGGMGNREGMRTLPLISYPPETVIGEVTRLFPRLDLNLNASPNLAVGALKLWLC